MIDYIYDGDKLLSYNGAICEYNNLGSPTKYKGKVCGWRYGKWLTKYDTHNFAYDSLNRLTFKDNTKLTYDSDGRLIKQSNGLEFFYDESGVAAVKYNNAMYFYRKDAQGNIIAILDSTGKVVVKYEYDACGNNTAYYLDNIGFVKADGLSNTESGNINSAYKSYYELATMNLFRYRGYYYDTETKLYYLQTRYYDPEVGRFISQDSVEYADPETINGLNLYAYCLNNPVMMTDETGNLPRWLKWLIAGITTAALIVGAVVLTVVSGGIASPTLAVATQFGASVLTGAAFGATLSLASQINSGDIDLGTFFIDVGVGAATGAISFGVGQILSAAGGSVGSYLNRITIKGLSVGKVFGDSLPKIFGKVLEFSGGAIFGAFLDKSINNLLRKKDSLQERIFNNIYGGFFSNILEFLKYVW